MTFTCHDLICGQFTSLLWSSKLWFPNTTTGLSVVSSRLQQHGIRGRVFIIEALETAPVLALAPQDMDSLWNELRTYHAIYSALFQHRELPEWFGHFKGMIVAVSPMPNQSSHYL